MSDPEQERRHFDRPTNWFNQTARRLMARLPAHEIDQEKVDALREDSLKIFGGIVLYKDALDEIRNYSWHVADTPCPPEVLSGEVTLDGNGNNPEIRYFNDAPVMHLPSKAAREAALLGATDHFNGHLYAYAAGCQDRGEEVAVHWQNRAAYERYRLGDNRFRWKPFSNMYGYRFHKGISFGAYASELVKIPRRIPAQAAMEFDELAYDGLTNWTRTMTWVPGSTGTTLYIRSVPETFQGKGLVSTVEKAYPEEYILTEASSALQIGRYGPPQKSDLDVLRMVEARIG